ncbi:MAG: ATP-binding protein [Armatimonadota bacterium]
MRHLRSLGFPIAVADPRWDAVAPNIAKGLRLYCDTLPARLARGQGLILGGNVGTGKTSCLALIALAARQRCEAMLLTAGKLFRALARPWEEAAAETLEMAHQVDLLLIDDLGTEAARSESLAAFHEFINGRTGNRRSLCLTTNCRPETLRNMPDLARAFDRIEELNPWLIAEGESRRRKAALQDWLITESEE